MNTSTVPMAQLGVAAQPVPLIGAGQIILVFVGVAALAVGLALILRRYGPGLGLVPVLPSSRGVAMTVLARQRLDPGVSLHIVKVGAERLAVLTSRSGVAMHALADEGTQASDAAAPADRRA